MKTTHYAFIALAACIAVSVSAQQKIDIAVYYDSGVWDDGVLAFEHFLDWKGVTHERIGASDVNTTDLKTRFKAIHFPGGYAFNYKRSIKQAGIQRIRDLVQNGGGYIGMCAGAYYACDSIIWEEDGTLDYPLNLFDGLGIGAIDAIAPWNGYAMTSISMNPRHPVNAFEPASATTLYFGGPYFVPHAGIAMDTVATWAEYNGNAAIITVPYGSGRVLLCGPHPEIEEDSDREGTLFGDEFLDEGSEWSFLWSAVDWLLGNPVTTPGTTPVDRGESALLEAPFLNQNYPNPFNGRTMIEYGIPAPGIVTLSVFDSFGREKAVLAHGYMPAGTHTARFDANGLASGMYLCKLALQPGMITWKLMMKR